MSVQKYLGLNHGVLKVIIIYFIQQKLNFKPAGTIVRAVKLG